MINIIDYILFIIYYLYSLSMAFPGSQNGDSGRGEKYGC